MYIEDAPPDVDDVWGIAMQNAILSSPKYRRPRGKFVVSNWPHDAFRHVFCVKLWALLHVLSFLILGRSHARNGGHLDALEKSSQASRIPLVLSDNGLRKLNKLWIFNFS